MSGVGNCGGTGRHRLDDGDRETGVAFQEIHILQEYGSDSVTEVSDHEPDDFSELETR